MKKNSIVIGLFILVSCGAPAQKKPVVTLDENDGLCEDAVYEIIMDKKGNLWVGTDNGLSKYNGHRFISFHKYDGLAGNRVWGLAVDSANRIYAGCYTGGLSILENGEIKKSWYFKKKKNNTIRKLLYDDRSKCLAVGTDYGMYIFKDTVFYPIHYPYPPDHQHIKSSVLALKRYKNRIFFTVHKYKGGVYELFINPASPGDSKAVQICSGNSMFGMTFFHDTLFSNNYSNYLYYSLNSGGHGLYARSRPDFLAWDMVTLPSGMIMAGGMKISHFGINARLFDIGKKRFTDVPWLLKSSSILSFCYDTLRGIVWAGTENGLKALVHSPFTYYNTDIDNIIDQAFLHDTLFLLSNRAIYFLDKGKVKILLTKKDIDRKFNARRDAYYKRTGQTGLSNFSYPLNYRYFVIDNDRIFLNTNQGSVTIPGFSVYLPFPEGHFMTDGKVGYYIQDYTRLVCFPDLDNASECIDTIGKSVGGIRDIMEIRRSGDVFYFMSVFHGLFALYHRKAWVLDEDNSGIDNYLVGMDVDPDGNVWIISANGNLFEVDFRDSLFLKRKINRFNTKIVGEDYKWMKFSNNYLFLGTNRGLNIMRREEVAAGKIENLWFYNEHNGYLNKSTADPVVDGRGRVYVHTGRQLLRIDARPGETYAGTMKIESVQLDGKPYDCRSLDGAKFPHSVRNIRISFYLMKYPADRNVSYHYRINRGEWSPSGIIDLQYPKPGNYKIEMEARDQERDKVYHIEKSFYIDRPFWGEWWFYLILVLILPLLVFILLRRRYERLRKEEEDKNRLIRENANLRIRALQMQMNPHFIFNSLNAIQGAVLTGDTGNVLTFIGNLSGVIRKNLENVSKEYILLSEEIAFLKEYAALEEYRLDKKIRFVFDVDVKDYGWLIPPMLIQPVIENAIKHGLYHKKEGGVVKIKVRELKRELLFVVEDNGVGRARAAELEKNHKHNSKGIRLIEQRLLYLNQKNNTASYRIVFTDLYHDDGTPAGTRAEIFFLMMKSTENLSQTANPS